LANVVSYAIPGVGGLVGGTIAGTAAQNAVYGAYTRPQEAEADQVGLQWMVAAGYDPQGMLRLFKALSASGSSSMPAFLSTHPANEERVKVVEAFIASSGNSPPKPSP
jgi:predicted Zn-dependent protease